MRYLIILMAAAPMICAAEWKVDVSKDPMDDTTTILVSQLGDKVDGGNHPEYYPVLAYRMADAKLNDSGKVMAKQHIFIGGKYNKFDPFKNDALIRVGTNKMEKVQITLDDSYSMATIPFSYNDRFKKSNEMWFRYTSAAGRVITYHFDLTGYKDAVDVAIKKVK